MTEFERLRRELAIALTEFNTAWDDAEQAVIEAAETITKEADQ